ncbi:bifunctional DNA primase/polymerase [Streptomyces bambusae]|uniref:bifunctional DNA primase/polymerase n=1 Tax=Streptomyces bambusae TaxID=1550616 RepID=UPI0021551840|nr:bifunctional DNA primase/polymerase [Streptomyces bambusae]
MQGSEIRTAVEWLVSAAPDPDACRWAWERNPLGVALLPAGRRWDVLVLPGDLGRAALHVLRRLPGRPGPVLAGSAAARVGFFVPEGTASRWLGTGVRGVGHGSWVAVPHPGRATGGMRWLVLPDGQGTLTDPALLELAMHDAVATVLRDREGRAGREGREGHEGRAGHEGDQG